MGGDTLSGAGCHSHYKAPPHGSVRAPVPTQLAAWAPTLGSGRCWEADTCPTGVLLSVVLPICLLPGMGLCLAPALLLLLLQLLGEWLPPPEDPSPLASLLDLQGQSKGARGLEKEVWGKNHNHSAGHGRETCIWGVPMPCHLPLPTSKSHLGTRSQRLSFSSWVPSPTSLTLLPSSVLELHTHSLVPRICYSTCLTSPSPAGASRREPSLDRVEPGGENGI